MVPGFDSQDRLGDPSPVFLSGFTPLAFISPEISARQQSYLPIAGDLVHGLQGISTHRRALRATCFGARPPPSTL